jgi:lipopolysaccharide transport system permease protein
MPTAALAIRFFRRELSNRFAGSFSGVLWALIQPLLQLAITSFVFVYVLRVRLPGANTLEFVPFLATALWPWVAFQEAVLRSTTAIQENAALIGKVALPREVLVLACVGTSFAIHVVGFVAVVLVLAALGKGIHLGGLLPALLLYLPLAALSLGLALMCAAVQVFVRDLAQGLGQLMPLLMFSAPVYYDRAQMPERFRGLLDFNPFTFYAESFRAFLLDHGAFDFRSLLVAVLVAAVVLWVGHGVFRRLDSHFEDFL